MYAYARARFYGRVLSDDSREQRNKRQLLEIPSGSAKLLDSDSTLKSLFFSDFVQL